MIISRDNHPRYAVYDLGDSALLPRHQERIFNMKTSVLSVIAAVAIANPSIAQEAVKKMVYEASDRDYFRIDVEYSMQADGREHCTLVLLDRQSETVLTMGVPGSRNENAYIILGVPNGSFGIGKPNEAQSLVFEFLDQNGEKTSNSVLGYWNYSVEEVIPTANIVSHLLLSRVDDLWGFARDWHASAAVFVENEAGETMASMTLHRAEEGVKALADCWSDTKD